MINCFICGLDIHTVYDYCYISTFVQDITIRIMNEFLLPNKRLYFIFWLRFALLFDIINMGIYKQVKP